MPELRKQKFEYKYTTFRANFLKNTLRVYEHSKNYNESLAGISNTIYGVVRNPISSQHLLDGSNLQ